MIRHFSLLALVAFAVTAHASNCDYLSIHLDETGTTCSVGDYAIGHVHNSHTSTLIATLMVDVSQCWNIATIGIEFGGDTDDGDGSEDLFVGAYVGADDDEEWQLYVTRDNWNTLASAYVTLSAPCTAGQKSVAPLWPGC